MDSRCGRSMNMESLSPEKAWEERGRQSCSSTYHDKVIQAHLRPTVDNGLTFDAILLSCLNNEEYYYQYLVEMVNSRLQYLDFNLRTSWNKRTELRQFTNEKLIGKGDFSRVYLVYDRDTNEQLAVKKMRVANTKTTDNMTRILQMFSEREALLTVAKSAFIINLLDSYLSEDHRSVFFVFEYCPACLKTYVKLLNVLSAKEFTRTYFAGQLFDKSLQLASEKYDFDVAYVNLIYSFELLAAIAFLAEKNVVHCDVKFENILVSENGHLKLADLGNVRRFRWFDRRSRALLTVPGDWDSLLRIDDSFVARGNYMFADPEITHQIYSDLYAGTDQMDKFESLGRIFVKNRDSFYDYEFLSDLFSIGEVIFALHSSGSLLSFFGSFTYQTIRKYLGDRIVKCDSSTLIWRYQIFYEMKSYFEIVHNPLKRIEKVSGISKILIEIFKRRDQRALHISRVKEIWYKSKKRKMLHLDMEIIEKLSVFRKGNINRNTVTSIVLPGALMGLVFGNGGLEEDGVGVSDDDDDVQGRFLPLSMLDVIPVTEYTFTRGLL